MARKKKNIKSINIKLSGLIASPAKSLSTKYSWINSEFQEDDNGKYSVTLLVDKNSHSGSKVEEYFNDLMDDAYQEFEDFKDIPLGGDSHFKCAIADGDDESHFKTYNEIYKGYYVITLKASKKFKIIDKDGYPLKHDEVTEDDFYPGIVATIQASLYYLNSGNVGVYTTLQRLKKNRDGEPLFDGYNTEIDLDLDEEDEEFFDNYFAEYEGGD